MEQLFSDTNSIAVDQSSGDLLVIDRAANTLSRYHADGTPSDFSALGTNTIDAKGTGDGTPQGGFVFGGFTGEQQIAVDNSGTATDGNIYVTQGHQAAGNLVDVFASSGEYLGQLTAAGATPFGTTGSFPFSPCGVAVDDSGNVYLGGGYDNKVYKFDPTANPPVNADHVASFPTSEPVCNLAAGAGPSASSLFVNTFATLKGNSVLELDSASGSLKGIAYSGEARLVSVDPGTGHLYVLAGELGPNQTFIKPAIKELDVAGADSALISTVDTGAAGLAVDETSGTLYRAGGARVYIYSPLLTAPDVTTGGFAVLGDTSIRVEGNVDPDGVALEECRFEYGTTTAYGQSKPCAESVGEIGIAPKDVHADLSGLEKETLYHYRLVAKNKDATIEGKDAIFKTPSKPAISGLWSQDVAFSEALLKAQVNPENSPTTYRIEWGPDTSYANSTAELALGSDAKDHTVLLPLSGLAPGATYHYRLVASNGIGVTTAPDHAFTTFPLATASTRNCPNEAFRAGAASRLADCRAYEMVSPVEKGGADVAVRLSGFNFPAGFDQASVDGGRFSFSSEKSFGDAVSAPFTSQYLATRVEGVGWGTHGISPLRDRPVRPLGKTTNATLDVQYKYFSPDLSEGWLHHDADPLLDECGVEGFANLYRRDDLGGYEALTIAKPPAPQDAIKYWPIVQGHSADGRVTVFAANAKLTADASSAGGSDPIYQLYEHVRDPEGGCGELRLLSVLPSGSASSLSASAGTVTQATVFGESRSSMLHNALSADGSRLFWSNANALFLHVEGQPKSVQVAAGLTQFWTADPDGTRAIYGAGGELREYDVASKASVPIAGQSSGVAGTSEDASRVYFVSREALGGEGQAGQQNLFLREGNGATATTRLVATLAAADVNTDFTHTPVSVVGLYPYMRGARVTPDGGAIVFPSTAPLTGYDNHDAASGEAAIELFRYDAEGEQLRCLSCAPSGGRPEARRIEGDNFKVRWAAALLPAWENQGFAPRALSDDGKALFFDSFDALLPRDTNGMRDVYEWEQAASAAECEAKGAELYVPASGGCLSLISTGRSPSDSELVDATPSGSDVFFKTAASLLPQDPGLVDIYDARANGGLPAPPGLPAPCEGEACQGLPAPPNDPTPASAAYRGPEGAPSAARCRKPKVRRKGRCVARKARHAKRAGNESKRAGDDRRQGR